MSRRFILTLLAAALFVIGSSSLVQAAGTVTVTTADVGGGVTRYTIAWVSDALGAVSGNTIAIKPGVIVAVKFTPDAAATQPTDLYDVTFEDPDDVDLLMGVGANLSNANATRVKPPVNTSDEVYFDGSASCELVVSNAGNAKGGTVYLFVRG